MHLSFPDLSLVLLIGPSGSGKSTFARRHFRPTEIVSSDFYRGVVCDDEADQAASRDAFELVHQVVARRLAWRRFTVIDATNLQSEARKPLIEAARSHHYLLSAVVFALPEDLCQQHNTLRPDRTVPSRVITTQTGMVNKAVESLEREGIRKVYIFRSVDEVMAATVRRTPMRFDRRYDHGPFDIIGDVHGCFEELLTLLERLGYRMIHQPDPRGLPGVVAEPPAGRKAIFVGDLGDRGPRTPDVYRLVMHMVRAGKAYCVMGNHDNKLERLLRGNDVNLSHGLALTVEQLDREPRALKEEIREFLDGLIDHYVFDDGKLVVAHAGLREDLQGRVSGKVRSFALFGDTTGHKDEHGMPVRLDWAAEYRGQALVVYGHTPVAEPTFRNNTINIDTGCVFGHRLTALRYPERELVSVPALKKYCEPGRPFLPVPGAIFPEAVRVEGREEDSEDLRQMNSVQTRLMGHVAIAESNPQAALEITSQFGAYPRWLVYLPPTMAPSAVSSSGLVEHPSEAFDYYRSNGVAQVVCQEKHTGSRAVAVVCMDEGVARRVFGIEGGSGVLYTRAGRRFFEGGHLELEMIARLRTALTRAAWWERFRTNWVILDAELLACSARAQELLPTECADTRRAGTAALADALALLGSRPDGGELAALAGRYLDRAQAVRQFLDAYQQDCWPSASVNDLKLAPFHILATQGAAHHDRPHAWHMTELADLCLVDADALKATGWLLVDVDSDESVQRGIQWWEDLTALGGEGVVVKPADFIPRSGRRLVQPAVKCRGGESLRLIYPRQDEAGENGERMRKRALAAKRGVALRQFALGIEALERFTRGESLRRVQECCLAILALECEPVDPRL